MYIIKRTTLNFKSSLFTLALVLIGVTSAFAPQNAVASYMFQYQFVGAQGSIAEGIIELNTNVGIVDENNVVAISIHSQGIGGSPMFETPFSSQNPVNSLNAVLPTVGEMGMINNLNFTDPDGNNMFAVNDFDCQNQLCDMIYQVNTGSPYFGEEVDSQSLSAVPEPAAVLLLGLGLAGLGFARRRQRNS